jgi:hypothetical protein
MSCAFNERQRVTAYLAIQTELEDVFERCFPELINAARHHREFLLLINQAWEAGEVITATQFDETLKKELGISQNTIDDRIKNLTDPHLVVSVSTEKDGRKHRLKLSDSAYDRMQQIGDHIAACILHYDALIRTRGPVPEKITFQDAPFDPRPDEKGKEK